MLDKEIKQIYPQLPLHDDEQEGSLCKADDGVNYRLKTIGDIQQQLNRERDDQEIIYIRNINVLLML